MTIPILKIDVPGALFIMAIIAIFIWSVRYRIMYIRRSKLVIDKMRVIVESASTLPEVTKAWNQLENECSIMVSGKRVSNIHHSYHAEYMELDTICKTKFKILAKI